MKHVHYYRIGAPVYRMGFEITTGRCFCGATLERMRPLNGDTIGTTPTLPERQGKPAPVRRGKR